jgi:hypothetical protein
MKPVLKPPGIKRLKLEYNKLVSNFAFNFNLRHHNWEEAGKKDVWGDKEVKAFNALKTAPLRGVTGALARLARDAGREAGPARFIPGCLLIVYMHMCARAHSRAGRLIPSCLLMVYLCARAVHTRRNLHPLAAATAV